MLKKPLVSTDFKVEKQVPLPRNMGRNHYPFNKMSPGDSFFIREEDALMVARVRYASMSYGKVHNMQFSTKRWENGYRCWRLK